MMSQNVPLGNVPALNDLLAGYAAGTLGAPLHALVSSHLALKPENRHFVRTLEALKGDAFEKSDPVQLSNRESMLEKIFRSEFGTPDGGDPVRDDVLPRALRSFIGSDLSSLPWKTRLPGIRECEISNRRNEEVSLLWIKPGRIMPSHTHGGSEITLVLKGGFTDSTGHYRRGDIAIADSEIDHRPKADDDEDCICFAVSEAPVRLTGPIARLFNYMTGR